MHERTGQIIGLYERHAHAFDQKRGRALFERSWLDRFATLVPAGGHILDLGCGMGEPIARYFIEQGYRVTGIDSAPTMISLCRGRFSDHVWQTADMRRLALGDRFDGVLAFDSFFHLSPDDQRAMFAVFAAHAAPGAPLMFTAGPAFGEAIGNFEGETLYHASLDPDEYRSLLARHGFAVVRYVPEDPDCGGRTVWLARRDEAR
ncbi:MAG: class I SAM-dependent methyltransferase [Pseudolabrys sp.]